MVKAADLSQTIGKVLVWLLVVTSIVVTPWMTVDPINLIKLVSLASGAFGIGALLLINSRSLLVSEHRLTMLLSALLLLQLTLVFMFSGVDKTFQFFGTMGRNTGLLCYVSLVLVLLGGLVASAKPLYEKVINSLFLVGAISALYGVIQYLGADPIGWANKYSPVIGFLGNPNFQSSLLGMGAIASLAILVNGSTQTLKRIFSLIAILISLFIAGVSNSQQGLLVFAIGSMCLAYFKVISKKQLIISTSFISVLTFSGLLAILGFLDKGPFAKYLYQASVTYRGDYWRAGWNMALDSPFFGVGLDSYGDNYRKFRTIEATLRRGPDVVSNAAHNVFIDFAANGGFPLLAIYLGFLFLAARKVWDYSKAGSKDLYFEGIIAVWIGYLAQSVISINQIGLAVWGWALTGLVIGWKSALELPNEIKGQPRNSINNKSNSTLSPKNFLVLITGLVIGLVVSLPPLVSSSKEKSAMAALQLEKILSAERNWPRDAWRSNQIVVILVSNKLEKDAIRIAKSTVSQFPKNYDAWKVLSEIPSSSEADKLQAKSQMKMLDPFNTNLK